MKSNYISVAVTVVLLQLLILSPHVAFSGMVKNPETAPAKIELDVYQMRLEQVATLITQQTGYSILLEPVLSDILITGHYSNISIDSFFKRVLKDENLIFEFNTVENTIKVNSFSGESQSLGGKTLNKNESSNLVSLDDIDLTSKSIHLDEIPVEDLGGIEIEEGMTLNYINDLNESQAQKNVRESNLLGLDLTIKELNTFHSEHKGSTEPFKTQ